MTRARRGSATWSPREAGSANRYDFGDDWEHDIVVEKVLAAEPGARYPTCVAGGGACCPPEDCGGFPGYERLRQILADPAHEEHEDMAGWLGLTNAAEFDPVRFDADEANHALAAVSMR
ncbi:MAG: plasmid pRiA4b ORF-3 family protein [Streptosporangiaceae bacterium]